jgi:hypothetical protein
MCLLAQNMELNIPSNEGERISNYTMCGYALSLTLLQNSFSNGSS